MRCKFTSTVPQEYVRCIVVQYGVLIVEVSSHLYSQLHSQNLERSQYIVVWRGGTYGAV